MRALLFALALFLTACGADPRPTLNTPADSLAMRVIDAHGGWEAWAALPTLRFDWIVERDSTEATRMRHLWDRAGDRARIEWSLGADTTAVVVLDLAASVPDAPSGEAWVNGAPSPPADSLVHRGYARFINDSYWMVAPLKSFDPGVSREIAADSSREGIQAFALTFDGVGLTPGDRYWWFVREDGTPVRWTYRLEGSTSASTWTWEAPETVSGPGGPVTFWTRKTMPGGRAIVTVPVAGDVPSDAWTSPLPVLAPRRSE
ncbi:MAG: hypothetical protein AAF791_07775 [Bacteroidota bacterium]